MKPMTNQIINNVRWIGFLLLILIGPSSLMARMDGRSNLLTLGPDSAGGALGDSMVANGRDATTIFYNPAGLVGQSSNIFVEHSKINEDATRSWAAASFGDPRLKYGLLWRSDQLPLSSHKDAVLFGVGASDDVLPWLVKFPGLSVGLTAGWISEKISNESGSTFMGNVGAEWKKQMGPSELGIGAQVKNAYFKGFSLRADGEKETWPRELEGGISYRFKNVTGLFELHRVDGQTSPSVGFEYIIGKILAMRIGYYDDFRVGLGVQFGNAQVAFGMRSAEFETVQAGSLAYDWEKTKEIDYTNPLNELEAQHKSLEAVLISKIHESVAMMQPMDISLPLKTLAVAPGNKEAWDLLQAKEGVKQFSVKIPSFSKARREYLEFAVAYANDKPEAKEYASRFIDRNKKSSASKLMSLILKLDLDKPVPPPIVSKHKRSNK